MVFPLDVWLLQAFNCTYRISATCHLDESTPIISIITREGRDKVLLRQYVISLSLATRLSIHRCQLSIFHTCRNAWQSLLHHSWQVLFCFCFILPLNYSGSRTASWQFGLLPVYDHFTLEWWHTWTSFSQCEIQRQRNYVHIFIHCFYNAVNKYIIPAFGLFGVILHSIVGQIYYDT